MKSIQRIAAAMAVLLIVVAAQHAGAQVTGGWSKVSARDPGVVAAARFAVEERGRQQRVKLKKIVRARKQIVAGTNYEITLLVKRGRASQRAVVVVWHKTDGTYEMTSWKWTGRKS
jgi:Aspartic acid proteinase inhibitor